MQRPEQVAKPEAGLPEYSVVSRRRFLQGTGAVGAGAIAGFPMIARAQQPVSLRLQGAWSAKDIFHEYALDLMPGTIPFLKKVWRSQTAWARRTVGWSREGLVDPAMAYDFWFGGARRKPQTGYIRSDEAT